MYKKFDSLSKFVIGVSAVLFTGTVALGDMAPNPRSALQVGRDNRDVQNVSEKNTSRSTVRHVASVNGRGEKTSVDRRATGARTVARTVMAPQKASVGGGRDSATVSRAATPLSRSAVRSAVVSTGNISNGRSGTTKKIRKAPLVRASVARATALFDDVSKIGGGYSQCRDSYATCMDQFCGKANETYRRCFCSSRFTDFRRTEEALDQAKVLLQSFEDNNLNAVDKTAAEVGAMYTATVGEAAIKNDTSGAQSILNEIGDLLSGKIKTSTSGVAASTSMGVLSLDFSTDLGDIWGGGGDAFGGGASSIFSSGGGQNLSNLEGEALYKAVDQQCRAMVGNSCESEAAFNMSKSSYGILITQDCNAYEKSLNAKREQVKSTVRQAEKILRQARLEDYRAHNSQDVNECLDRVRSAMLVDTACGKGYRRCLDYTGVYINQQTGDPIYSQRLFQLTNLIKLDGESSDVLMQNREFNDFLDGRKMFANQALDTCRDISDTVWSEFKRAALIEIAQAQDEKIEEVKGTCVSTMAECYDTNTNALKDADTTKAQASGAAVAYAAKQMCADKVIACASLYGDTEGCTFDGNGVLQTGNGKDTAGRCGLTALLAFVDTVDNVRVAEGCADALTNYVQTLCAPTAGDEGKTFPWGCRKRSLASIKTDIVDFAVRNCADPDKDEITGSTDEKLEKLGEQAAEVRETINRTLDSIREQITVTMRNECYAVTADGTVVFDETGLAFDDENNPEVSVSPTWLRNVFGSEAELKQLAQTGVYGYKLILESGSRAGESVTQGTSDNGGNRSLGYGVCTIPSLRQWCNMQKQLAGVGETAGVYNETTRTCELSDAWYSYRCRMAGGYYVESEKHCYIKR